MSDIKAFAERFAAIKERSRAEEGPSLAERKARRLDVFAGLPPLDAARLLYEWRFWARPKQLPPAGKWDVWAIVGGRGFGKNRTGAEWVRSRVESGAARSIALIGPTTGDIRRYMIGGYKGKARNGSGLLDVCPPWCMPHMNEVKGELHWPNGAVAYVCTAERPELRGANLDTIWGDEIIKWRYADPLWENLQLTLREKGIARPQVCLTTTPRPLELLRSIILDEGTHTTHATTRENASNVHRAWLARMDRIMGGTRQGLQELEAELLGDNPAALFHRAVIDAYRVLVAPPLVRILIGVDPSTSKHRQSDPTGLIAGGIARNGEVYVLADGTNKYTPEQWGDKGFELHDGHGADGFVVERNKVGDLAAMNLRAAAARRKQGPPKIFEVQAMGDKGERAKPVSTLYAKGRVHHVGRLPQLEDEMTEWDPSSNVSPNRLDALVHMVVELTGIDKEEPEPPDPSKRVAAWLNRHRNVRPSPRDTL